LAYHKSGHRLLLYYPSIEDLTVCFYTAVKIVKPKLGLPPASRASVLELVPRIDTALTEEERAELERAVDIFWEDEGGRTDIAAWVAAVEYCATRTGSLLAGDFHVAAAILRDEPSVMISFEEKMADLVGFTLSEEYHLLREELGIAIKP